MIVIIFNVWTFLSFLKIFLVEACFFWSHLSSCNEINFIFFHYLRSQILPVILIILFLSHLLSSVSFLEFLLVLDGSLKFILLLHLRLGLLISLYLQGILHILCHFSSHSHFLLHFDSIFFFSEFISGITLPLCLFLLDLLHDV